MVSTSKVPTISKLPLRFRTVLGTVEIPLPRISRYLGSPDRWLKLISSAMRSLESPETTFHSSSKLVLVHAFALNAKNGLDTTLTRDGFML